MSIERPEIENVTEADLQELIEACVPESLKLEFKQSTYGNSDAQKRELLKDVSAFANAQGGHLILGIRENRGIAHELVGLPGIDGDAEMQRIQQLIRSAIEPPITGVRMVTIPLSTGGSAVLIRIPRSWNPPHRVIHKGVNRFHVRHSGGVHEPSVEELRTMCSQYSTALDQARLFQQERLDYIEMGKDSYPLTGTSRFILHIIPIAAFSGAINLDVQQISEMSDTLKPIGSAGWGSRYNYHGFINITDETENTGYTQVFRNGCLEATQANIVFDWNDRDVIGGLGLEEEIFSQLHPYLITLRDLNVPPPLIMMFTLHGVEGAYYEIGPDYWRRNPRPFPDDIIILPECFIADYSSEEDHHRAVQPAFDVLWNTIGFAKSGFFDKSGLWVGEKNRR